MLAGCASGLKSYNKGDYYTACLEAVKKLRSKPDNQDARTALTNAYPLAQANALRDISKITSINDHINYDKVVVAYDRLNKLADEINRCPAALLIVPFPAEYHAERRAALEIMAQTYYDEGVKALNYGTLEKARAALDYFIIINNYTPGYRDVTAKIDQATYEATLRVLVMQPQVSAKYQYNADFFYVKLMAEITRRTYKNLVHFYTPEEAAAEGMTNPHQILIMNFQDFTVGNSRETSDTTEYRKDNIKIGTVTNPDGSNQDVMGTVKAKLTKNRIEIVSGGVMGIQITDAMTGRILDHKTFKRSYTWSAEWGYFNGDERALTKEQLAITSKRQQPVPQTQELFANFASPLYEGVSRYISTIYR